jgi:uncharacterized DUF497 family protein
MDELICAKFEWDEWNIAHIARHDVVPLEVNQAFFDRRSLHRSEGIRFGERRFTMVGKTEDGRLLFVVYTIRRGAIRTVTAYTASQQDARVYETGR